MGNRILNGTGYVVGFAFTPDMKNVALIRKCRVRPGFEWMLGQINGLGGKIQEGELPRQAMAREFKEESGVEIPAEDWRLCGSFYRRREYEVVVFRSVSTAVLDVRTASPEEGEVKVLPVDRLHHYPTTRAMSWIIPLITYPDLCVFRVAEK